MNVQDAEYAAIQVLRPRLESEGYELLDEVPSNSLPSGLKGYRPDLVARKNSRFLAIEIKNRRHPSIEKKLDQIASVFEESGGWSFEVYYADELNAPKGPSLQDEATIDTALKEAMSLFENEQIKPAFLMTWAAFEAIARKLHSTAFERPQSPGRLVTVLAENGDLTPKQAAEVRDLIVKRNALIHGQLDIDVTNSDLKSLLAVIIDLRHKPEKLVEN